MPKIDEVFHRHRKNYRKKEKLDLLRDIKEQIEENSDMVAILEKGTQSRRLVTVTADRAYLDDDFDYACWDMVLSLLSRFGGGSRIRKPLHQVRVINWHARRQELLDILKLLRANPAISYGRLLILTYHPRVIADGIDPSGWIQPTP